MGAHAMRPMTVNLPGEVVQVEASDLEDLRQARGKGIELAGRLRQEHVDEVWASSKMTPLEAIAAGLGARGERSWLIIDGRVEALFGCQPLTQNPTVGVVWLLSSASVDAYREALIHLFPHVVRHYLQSFEVLTNFVDARFRPALRWAEYLGFEVLPARPYGPLGLDFHQIVLRR